MAQLSDTGNKIYAENFLGGLSVNNWDYGGGKDCFPDTRTACSHPDILPPPKLLPYYSE